MSFTNEDDAVQRANETPYGLRASVWTANADRARHLADRVQAGAVFWNSHGIFRDLHYRISWSETKRVEPRVASRALDHYVDTYGFAQ
jgi:acyl-CoA reductase-like NAD-dependent aldehyde dehydrogenase